MCGLVLGCAIMADVDLSQLFEEFAIHCTAEDVQVMKSTFESISHSFVHPRQAVE